MAFRRSSSVEMRTPAILSASLHVVALVLAIANLPWFRSPPIEPEPVMVDFVAIDKHAAAPKIGNPPPQPKDAKIAEETTKAPPPKTADAQPTPPEPPKKEVAEAKPIAPMPVEKPKPEPPKPTEDVVALKPKQPEPPKEEKKIEPPKPEPPKPEVKKVEPPKPPPPKPPEPKKPNVDALVDSILKNQDSKTKIQTPEQQPKPVKEITRTAPAAPQLAAVVTASEIEGVRSKIRPCWNPTPGARDQPIVTMTVQMGQDGTPVKADIQDTGRYSRDPVFRSAADAAYRAVMNPRCQPWPLPSDRYNGWRTITFNFDPRDY
ncbi:MAG: hypothetical protein ACM3II_04145 [Rhodospirillaceae bacterium]